MTIQNCFNTGDLTATFTDGDFYCGGVAGYVDAGADANGQGKVTIQNCFSTGAQNVTVTSASGSAYSGGVAGYVYAGAGAAGQGAGTVNLSNCYYADDTAADAYGYKYVGDGAIVDTDKLATKTAEQFKSGEVAYLLNLNGESSDGVWKQTLSGTEKMSVPGFTGGTVYRNYKDCKDTEYSNIQGSATPLHDYTNNNGFCTMCGEYEPCEGEGTATEPFLIKNAGNLYWFAAQVNSGNTSINAKLTADIIVNASVLTDGKLPTDTSALKQWTPIGNDTNTYQGTFDGQNHTISGLYYNGSDQYVGLFGYIAGGAVIQNVGVIDSCFQVSGNYRYLGGIVGYAGANSFPYAAGSITISGCSSAALLTSTANNAYVGGVAGYVNTYGGSVTIQNCSNTGKITATSASEYDMLYSGGVVGAVSAYQANVTIQNCFNTGEITATSTYNAYCGGVAGFASAGKCFVTIQNCFSTGAQNVTATGGAFSGGVAGFASANGEADSQGTVTLSNCYYTAEKDCGGQSAGDGAEVTTEKVATKDADAFASGEVAWLLNGESSDGVWKQTLSGTGTMSAPGFSGQTVIRNETEGETGSTYSNEPFVSVTITWTSMEFTYTDGQWNPTKHDYDDGTWSAGAGNGTVTVKNDGNVAITVELTFAATIDGISGDFGDQSSFSLEANEESGTATATLALSGRPSGALSKEPLGSITVSIKQQQQQQSNE